MAFLSMFLILCGPFVGSFVQASANIWPDRSNAVQIHSVCQHCHTKLKVFDLIPIVSYLWLRGKCRSCETSFGSAHLFTECAAALIAISAVIVFNGWLMLVTALLGWVLLFASLVDFRLRLLPDGATLGLTLAGAIVLFWQAGVPGLWFAGLGAGFGYGVFYIIAKGYRILRGRDGLGLGDAKLLAAGGAWAGPFALSWIVLLAACFALVGLWITSTIRGQKPKADTALSFGPALALAIYLIWLWSGQGDEGLRLLYL
ncbi:MAG: prepilin peptidase [Robiginitomaculum sp.]|nr:prepilin peptidase [Robiginitomaculum sp.]